MRELGEWLIVVPARLASTRLPKKPLQDLCGKPLVIRVLENLVFFQKTGATLIAAVDNKETQTTVESFGYKCILTDPNHPSGTDRCLEVSRAYPNQTFILNVQGDEPFVAKEDLEHVVQTHALNPYFEMVTLAFPNKNSQDFQNPHCVKAVCDEKGRALYFSRAPIPYLREKEGNKAQTFLHHMGLYSFTQKALQKFCTAQPSKLETLECLEQLRALELGMHIQVVEAQKFCRGIDTPEDLERARKEFESLEKSKIS